MWNKLKYKIPLLVFSVIIFNSIISFFSLTYVEKKWFQLNEERSKRQLKKAFEFVYNNETVDLASFWRRWLVNKNLIYLEGDKKNLEKWRHRILGMTNTSAIKFGTHTILSFSENKKLIEAFSIGNHKLDDKVHTVMNDLINRADEEDSHQVKIFKNREGQFFHGLVMISNDELTDLRTYHIVLSSIRFISKKMEKLLGGKVNIIGKNQRTKDQRMINFKGLTLFKNGHKWDILRTIHIEPSANNVGMDIDYYFPFTEMKNKSNEMETDILILLIISSCLITLLIWSIINKFLLPIRNIFILSEAIKKGNYSFRGDFSSNTEIDILGKDLNSMVEKIEFKNREINLLVKKMDEILIQKTQFFAGMSHDLRTPLNGILGVCQIMELKENLSDYEKELLGIIKLSGDNLLSLVNDILDYSKINSSHFALGNKKFNLFSLIQDIINLTKVIVKNKTIDFIEDIKIKEDYWVYSDDIRLKQVLNNILANAIKFTEKGHVTLKIDIEKGDEITFSVEDTGIGMSKGEVERIFKSFIQANSETVNRFGGTGLGLAISKEIILLMGGEIKVKSEPGVGSLFFFKLKFLRQEALKPVSKNDGHKEDFVKNYPIKILLVEDNENNIKIAADLLKSINQNVDVAKDGFKAVNACLSQHYDLVLMDCALPLLSGYEATQKIKSECYKPPIIVALTANSLKENVQKCYSSGMDNFLAKPIQRSELINVIFQYFDTKTP